MLLTRVRLVAVGPFGDTTLDFRDDRSASHHILVVFGGDGTGKTSVLNAIAATRPGHAVALPHSSSRAALSPIAHPGDGLAVLATVPHAVTSWHLGDDDRERPHEFVVTSPNAPSPPVSEAEEAMARRREQTHFDRRAVEGGFCLVAFSGARWFSRTPALLTAPQRSILRYDVRTSAAFDDPARADLARETKQVLLFAAVAAALCNGGSWPVEPPGDPACGPFVPTSNAPDGTPTDALLGRALAEALPSVLAPFDASFTGVDVATFEPSFALRGRQVMFDELPRQLRHGVAFVALTLRALHAAFPGRNPRDGEGVVLIDDAELHLDTAALRLLPAALRSSLPRVQWILTTTSPLLASAAAGEQGAVVALRREDPAGPTTAHTAANAIFH